MERAARQGPPGRGPVGRVQRRRKSWPRARAERESRAVARARARKRGSRAGSRRARHGEHGGTLAGGPRGREAPRPTGPAERGGALGPAGGAPEGRAGCGGRGGHSRVGLPCPHDPPGCGRKTGRREQEQGARRSEAVAATGSVDRREGEERCDSGAKTMKKEAGRKRAPQSAEAKRYVRSVGILETPGRWA